MIIWINLSAAGKTFGRLSSTGQLECKRGEISVVFDVAETLRTGGVVVKTINGRPPPRRRQAQNSPGEAIVIPEIMC